MTTLFRLLCYCSGASGVRRRHRVDDETGTLNVILVVILPVAEMILVLILISLMRIAYVKLCRRSDDPKMLDVVVSATQSDYEKNASSPQRIADFSDPPVKTSHNHSSC